MVCGLGLIGGVDWNEFHRGLHGIKSGTVIYGGMKSFSMNQRLVCRRQHEGLRTAKVESLLYF